MEKRFNFRPYTYTPRYTSKLQFYDDDGTNMSLMLSADITEGFIFGWLSSPMLFCLLSLRQWKAH